MSPFKSDLDAALARAESVEKEKKKLEKEVAKLKNPAPKKPPASKSPLTISDKYSLLATIALAITWTCVLINVLIPPKFFWPIFSFQVILGIVYVVLKIKLKKLQRP